MPSNRSKIPQFQDFIDFQGPYWENRQNLIAKKIPFADFTFGNPQDPPSQELISVLQKPFNAPEAKTDPSYFAYTLNLEPSLAAVSDVLFERRGVRYPPEDISFTNAALSGLTVAIQAVTDPGDEVIIMTPFVRI